MASPRARRPRRRKELPSRSACPPSISMTTCSASWTPPKGGRTSERVPSGSLRCWRSIPYEGDLDFGTNYMSVDAGGHAQHLRDRDPRWPLSRYGAHRAGRRRHVADRGRDLGDSEPNKPWDLEAERKGPAGFGLALGLAAPLVERAAIEVPADISPKFVAAAMLTAKVPLFLESVAVRRDAEAGSQYRR